VKKTNTNKGVGRSSLMHVGRRVDYAVRALAYLAAQPPDRVVPKVEIEEKQDIPTHYLSKIMKDLVASGLVHSHVGPKGGFRLARPAREITLRAVYESVEGPLVLMQCVEQGKAFCDYFGVCTQNSVWEKIQALVLNYLATVSVDEIVDREGLRERLVNTQAALLNPIQQIQ
jgi:Rrf2 family protein